MKQRLQTKRLKDDSANLRAINRKIEELKKEFTKRKYNHVGRLYEVLDKIVKLKQETNPRYAPRSLEWEEGLNVTSTEIRYIFSYQYISSYSKKKVLDGIIDDTTICQILVTSSLYREVQWQKVIVDKIINKEIKISEIAEFTQKETKSYLEGKLKLRSDDEYFITATKNLRHIKARIKDRGHLLKKSVYRDNVVNAVKSLNKLIGTLTK